jgi:hypothetical protein
MEITNRKQYQKFSYDDRFLLGAFDNKSKFLQFLSVEPPKSIPNMGSRGMEFFLTLANKMANFIKDECEQPLPASDLERAYSTSPKRSSA